MSCWPYHREGRRPPARPRRRFPSGKTFPSWKPDAIVDPDAHAAGASHPGMMHLVVCGLSGTGKTFLLEALGQLAVEKGVHVAWCTLDDLRGLVRRHGGWLRQQCHRTDQIGKCYEQAVKERQLRALANIHPDLSAGVAAGPGLPAPGIPVGRSTCRP